MILSTVNMYHFISQVYLIKLRGFYSLKTEETKESHTKII